MKLEQLQFWTDDSGENPCFRQSPGGQRWHFVPGCTNFPHVKIDREVCYEPPSSQICKKCRKRSWKGEPVYRTDRSARRRFGQRVLDWLPVAAGRTRLLR